MPALVRLLTVTLFVAFLFAGQGLGMLSHPSEGEAQAEQVECGDALPRHAPRKGARRRHPEQPLARAVPPLDGARPQPAHSGLALEPGATSVGWSRPARC